MILLVAWHESTRCRDNAPPGQSGSRAEQIANGARRPRIPSLGGHLAVRHYLARIETVEDGDDGIGEVEI